MLKVTNKILAKLQTVTVTSNIKNEKTLKITGVILGLAILIILIWLAKGVSEYTKYNQDMSKVTHIELHLNEDIEDLKTVDIIICDSVHTYTVQQIKDTVSENVSISNGRFPCIAEFTYHFANDIQMIYKVDSFNCTGCSGTNSYSLGQNNIVYTYKN